MIDDLNSTTARTDIPGEVYPEGDLPQLSGGKAALQPGVDTFQLPVDLPSLWHTVIIERDGVKYQHAQLKFDKDHPLVAVGGPNNGAPMLASFSTVPRARGKKDDPKTVFVSDLALFLEVGLGDVSRPLARGGEQGIAAMKAAVNKYGGRSIRLEHGLSAQCRPDKVRYVFKDANSTESQLDPTGQHGCGTRYYIKDFRAPNAKVGEPLYDEIIECKKCGAAIRGFESVERFLPPGK